VGKFGRLEKYVEISFITLYTTADAMGLKANEGKAKYMIVKGNKEQTTRIMDYTHIFDTVHGYANYRLGEQGIETRSE